MLIEDEELRSLYQVASSDHLAKLEAGLLFLEKNPQDTNKLKEMLRTAHSLKGDSRMLGVKDAETLTHSFEDILSKIYNGELTLSQSISETLFRALDGIKRIALEAVTGKPAEVSVFHLVAEMMTAVEEGGSTDASSAVAENVETAPITSDNRESITTLSSSEIPAPPVELEEQSDIIRVKASKLDSLMQYAIELAVIQQRLHRQLRLIVNPNDLSGDTSQGEKRLVNFDKVEELTTRIQSGLETEISRLQSLTTLLEEDIKSLQLVPFANVFNLFPRMVRDIAKQQNKKVDFIITGGDVLVDRKILEEVKDPISHLLRNAIDHGLETTEERIKLGKPPRGRLLLKGAVEGNQITIEVTDDGRGLDLEAIATAAVNKGLITPAELAIMKPEEIEQLIFRHGFSTKSTAEVSEISGRGVGLDVVREMIDRLQGQIKIQSQRGAGCTFKLLIKARRSIIPVLVVKEGKYYYAVPTDTVITSILGKRDDIFMTEDRPAIIWQEQIVKLSLLGNLIQNGNPEIPKNFTCLILQVDEQMQGLVVENIIDYQEVRIKPHPFAVPQLLGVTTLEDGTICQVLNPSRLLSAITKLSIASILPEERRPARVLLVEDSIPIRTQLRRILEAEGYQVAIAVDGNDGLAKLKQGTFDAIISDVEMPNLNGIEMTKSIRTTMPDIPIVLVTTLAKPSDREAGLKAGANAYITKGDFDQSLLLNTLRRLIK
jgi:two-component system chemotaxis sensor kinase CheA